VRIAVKRLRYALEIRATLRGARASTQLRQLRALQDLLGRAHDLHVLAERLRHVQLRVVGNPRGSVCVFL
jgi:CHAD domain-containing protein